MIVLITLVSTCLVLWAAPAATLHRVATEVPVEIVTQLRAEGYEIELNATGTASDLVAAPIALNRDAEPELRVHGIGPTICGMANCITWIYQKVGSSYKLLLEAGSINRIELQKSFSKGYRDIMTVMHGSAWESDLKLYKFDGKRYQLVGCFFRTYQYEDRHGTMREWKRPRITRSECGPKEDSWRPTPSMHRMAAEFASRNVEFSEPLKDTDDGLRGFDLKDADGYVLFFGRPR